MSNNPDEQSSGGGGTKTCPVCRAENEPEATQCSACDYIFGDEATLPGADGGVECPHCGAALAPGSVSCVVCGGTVDTVSPAEMTPGEAETAPGVDEGNILCPGCGAELPADTVNCFICGESLERAEISAETAPADDGEWDLGVVGGDEVPPGEDYEESEIPEDAEVPEEAPYEEYEEPAPPAEPGEEPAEDKPELGPNEFACPNCGLAVTVGSSRCSSCWTELPDMIRCPNCDFIIPLDSTSCPECYSTLEAGVLIEGPPEAEAPEAEAEVPEDISEEPEEELMPDEEDFEEETIEEITEVYGVECPFCGAVVHAGEDICPECGMPLIEQEGEEPKPETEAKPERDWYKIIAFILVIVLLITAIIPFAIPLPRVDRDRIRIDGAFGDWTNINSHADQLDTPLNPNVDIIDYRLVTDAFNTYSYVQVEGDVFGDIEGDTARIFLDVDQDETTGYSIMGTGADYQLRVFGHSGEVESSSCMLFDNTRPQNDFNGFNSHCPSVPYVGQTAGDTDKVEVRVGLEDLGLLRDQPITAVFYMGNAQGEHDFSDAPISNMGTVLVVRQSSIVPANGLITAAGNSVLNLDLSVSGGQTNISAINIPSCSVTGSYNTVAGNTSVQVVVSRDTAGLTTSAFVNVEAQPSHFTTDNADVVVLGSGAYAYYGTAPTTVQIDGAFADWAGKGTALNDAADDAMAKNDIDAFDEPGLDIQEQRTAVESNNLNILVSTASNGEVFAGMWVPETEEVYVDTTKNTRSETANEQYNPYKYTEPVVKEGTRNPDITRPATKPLRTGEGCVKVFVDADNDDTTGYWIDDLGPNQDEYLGADMLIEVYGEANKVTRTFFYSFSGTDQNMQDWTENAGVAPQGASSGNQVEIAVPISAFGSAATSNATAVIQLVNWNLNGDISDLPSWDIFDVTRRKSGTRGFPPVQGVKGRITVNDSLYSNATVIMKDLFNSRISTDISVIPSQPKANNYRINQEFSPNHTVGMYVVNSTHWGYNETVYPTATDKVCHIELTELLPDISPKNLTATNLGPGTQAIELTWDHNSDPNEYRIYRTNITDSYFGYTNVGRYYGLWDVVLPGANSSYVDYDLHLNETNWYMVEANDASWNYNYSIEVSAVADFWAPVIVHENMTAGYTQNVKVETDVFDGCNVEEVIVYYKKAGEPAWSQSLMSPVDGQVDEKSNSGTWRSFINAPTAGLYEYYLSAWDGTNPPTLFGGPGNSIPLQVNASDDPYPIYGYVYLYNGSFAGGYSPVILPFANVWVSWLNTTTGAYSTIATQANALGQYSVDLGNYSNFGTVFCNATDTGIYGNSGYNVTQIDIVGVQGGRQENIVCGVPYNVTITTPPDGSNVTSGTPFATTYEIRDIDNRRAWGYYTIDPLWDGRTVWTSNDTLFVPPALYTWNGLLEATPGQWNGFLTLSSIGSFWINISEQIVDFQLTVWHAQVPAIKDWDNITLNVIGGLLNITKTAPATANTGQIITYFLTYRNDGADWVYNSRVTETYPLDVTFQGSLPAPNIGNNIWLTGPLGPGASNSIAINVRVDDNATGVLTNMANFTGETSDGRQLPYDLAWANTTIIDPLMSITKTGPPTANTGETIMYTINYQNIGTDTAYDVWIYETYPAGVNYVTANPLPTVGNDQWFIGNLAPLAGGSIDIFVTVTATGGILNNTVIVEYDDANGEAQEPVEAWWITTISNPDMNIFKTAPATAVTGETIMYMITYENVGNDWAYNVWINDTIPPSTIFVDSNPVATFPGPPTWSFNIGNVAPGSIGYIYINVTIGPAASGTITNWAYLEFQDAAGQDFGPIAAWAQTTIVNPFIDVTKWAPPTANPGEIITYLINYSNTGNAPAYDVWINDTLPVGVTYLGAVPAPFSPGPPVWTWFFAMIPAGTNGTIAITVQIDPGTSGMLMNNVTVQYSNAAQTMPQESASAITIISDPFMVITKTAPATANPGDNITYTITYQNNGLDTAYDVEIWEFYPPGVTFISSNPPPTMVPDYWYMGDLLPGQGGTINITVHIDSGASGILNNTVVLFYENSAGTQYYVEAWAETLISWPQMIVDKIGPVNGTANQTIPYTIYYVNNGTDTAYNVWINDTLPNGVTFVNSNPVPDYQVLPDLGWNIGNVPPGGFGYIYINVTIDPGTTGLLVNNVTLEYQNSANASMPIETDQWTTFISGPLMVITKDGPVTVNPGGTMTYWINYTNIGDDTAYNVVIEESYPPWVTYVNAVPAPTSGDNVWQIGNLAAGANGTIVITVQVDPMVPLGTWLENWAFLNYTNSAGAWYQTVMDSCITEVVNPLMTISKTGPATAVFGETITYTIIYWNIGTDTAYNVWINDTLPLGVIYVGAFPPPTALGPPYWCWNVGNVAPGTGGTILINVTVNVQIGTIVNEVGLVYENLAGQNYAINATCVTNIIGPYVLITKSAPPTAAPGQTITYMINYINIGTDWAYNIVITENYPLGVTYITAIPLPSVGNNIWDGSTVPQLAALAPGGSGSIQITVMIDPTASGALNNTVDMIYENSAGIQYFGSAWDITVIINAVVTITKTAPATANTGQVITYWLDYANIGQDWAYNVWITETYPAGVTFISATPNATVGNNMWFFAALAPGASDSIQITVQVNAGLPIGTVLTNNVTVTYENVGGMQFQDWAEATTMIVDPLMTITKAGPATATPGETIVYTITYQNTGTDIAYNVVITETYPPEVTYVTANPLPTSGNNVWQLGNVPPGPPQVITITVTVSTTASGTITNLVVLDYENAFIAMPSVSDTHNTTLINPYVDIFKTAPPQANVGQNFDYTITVINTGPEWAYNVWVNDTLPADVTYVSSTIVPTVAADPFYAWNLLPLAPGASQTIYITVTVGPNATLIINNATVNYTNLGGVWFSNWDTAITLVEGPMLLVTKTAPTTANTGEVIVYTITIENIGNAPAYNVVVTEAYPAGLTFVMALPSPDNPPFNNIWAVNLTNPMPVGWIETIQIWLSVDIGTSGMLMNTVSVDYENATGAQWPTEWAYANTTIIDPLLTITKAAPATANTGEMITYTLTVTNIGRDIAYNVWVNDTLPVGVTFVNSNPLPDYAAPPVYGWLLGDLNPGESRTITITVQITAPSGTMMNQASAEYSNGFRNMPAVWAFANTTIINPNVMIAKWAPATANSGEIIVYWINYTNTGTDWAYNVVITETYPLGVSFISALPSPTSGNDVWYIGDLSPGGSGSIWISVQIAPWATGLLINNVDIVYENGAGYQFRDNATAATQIIDPLMSITKTAPATATPGEQITYTLNYLNIGTDTAYNVVITETYPAGVTFVGAVPMPTSGNNVWYIGTVPQGFGGTITITVDVVPTATGVLVNNVMLEYDSAVRPMTPVYAQAQTVIINPFLIITKTAPATANTGEQIMYSIRIENVGTANATNVVVAETYPVGVTYVSASPAPSVGNNTWNLGTLVPGQIVWIFINVTVTATSGILNNVAVVNYENTAGISYGPEQASAQTLIINPVMEITKWAPPSANTGQWITYYINYTNSGNDWAYDVVITETYPPGVTFISAFPAPDIPTNNVWSVDDIAPGGSGTIMITVQVNANISGALVNFVELTYNNSVGIPQTPVNATAITWVGDPMINVIKYAPATAVVGDTIMYVIYYWNNGTADAYNVVITETYPPNTVFVNATPWPTSGNNVWTFPVVPAGTNGTIFINLTIGPNANGTLINLVNVMYENMAGQIMEENTSAITVITGPWINIIKIAPQNANPGEIIMYIIQYSNVGLDDAHNVWINETYPPGVTYLNSNPAPAVGDYAWFFALIPAGTTGNIYINVTIDMNATGDLINIVVVQFENVAGEQMQNQAQAITMLNEPELDITKEGPPFANPGEMISYWINYTNIGTDWAYDVIITETYPADVTFFSATPAPTSGDNVWFIGDLAPGASGSIQIWVTIDPAATNPQVNFVEATYNNSAGIPMPPENATLVTIVANPLLVATKWAPAQANPGDIITYWINITNIGQDWAYNIVVVETYPAEVTFLNAVPFPDVSDYIWLNLGPLAPGASTSIMITVMIALNATGTITNVADVDYDNGVSIPMEHIQVTAQTVIIIPQLVITKIAPATAGTGEIITYTVTVTNIGTDYAYNVVVTETYPSGVTFQSANPGPDTGNNIWFVGTMAPGASWTVIITVRVNNNATGSLLNTVVATYQGPGEGGPQYPPVQAQAITIIADPYLIVTKQAPAYANPGQTITYWINITNLGNADALNVVLTETYPPWIIFISAIPPPTSTIPNHQWNIGTIAPGATVTIQITVQIDQNASGTLRDWVDVSYRNVARPMTPVSAYADTMIIAPEMVITKWAPPMANTGEIITYWINYTNVGSDWAYDVIITEVYPPGVTFVNSTPLPDIPNWAWYVGDVAPNATGSIMILVSVNDNAVGFLDNWVYLDYNSTAMVMPQESAFARTQVIDPVLTITKIAPVTTNPGAQITYQLVIENIGNAPAHDVWVYDFYPPGVTFVSSTPLPTNYPNGWYFPMINAGNTLIITITVDVNPALLNGTVLENYAWVNYTDANQEFQDEVEAWANTTVITPEIILSKWATPYANPGDYITYWINYTNVGGDWAYNVVIIETYSPNVTFSNSTPNPTIGFDTWIIPALAPGASGSIEITVQVNIGATGILLNHVDLDYENGAGYQYPTIWAEAITVIGETPYVAIWKTAPPTANSGQVIQYVITYQNIGNSTATNVWINDTLPNGVVFLSSNPPASVNNTPLYCWFIGVLLAGAGGTIIINVSVDGTVYGILTDVVYVDCANATGVAQPRRYATAFTEVMDPLMEITKDAPPIANNGDTIMYTITYFNSGNDTAYDVWIYDTLPAGASYFDSNPTPPDYINPPVYGWFVGNVTPQTGGVIFINVTLNYSGGGTAINNVTMNYTNANNMNQTANASAQTIVVIVATGYIVVTKWATPTVNPGGVITYIINYTNVGNGPANNVVIDDSFPPNTVFWNATVNSVPTGVAPPYAIGVVNPGESGTVVIIVNVTLAANGTLVNWAWANWTGGSTNASAITLVVNPSMYITKSAPAFAQPNANIQYTIQYFNVGTDHAYNVVITDNYPPVGFNYYSATPPPDIGNNVWLIASVPPGGSGTITVYGNLTATAGDVLVNWVWLNYTNGANISMGPESANATTEITDAIMTLAKTATPLNANPGDIVTYTISAQNLGPGTATNITIEEFYPAGMQFQSAIPAPTIGNNIWLIASLAPTMTYSITIFMLVLPNATGILTNRAQLNYTDTGDNPHFLNATAITIIGEPYMTLSKSAPPSAQVGQQIMYTITFQNIGSGYAANVTVTENYPYGVLFITATPGPSSGNNVWNLGVLAPGQMLTILITVEILPIAYDTLTNWVYLEYTNLSGGQQPMRQAYAQTNVGPPIMVISKTGPATANTGQYITYTIAYNNVGLGTARNVLVEDVIPAGVDPNPASISSNPPGVIFGGRILWALGNVAGQTGGTITVTFLVTASAPFVINNWVFLNYTDLSGNQKPTVSDNALTYVVAPNVSVTKWAPATALSGQTITYWINYSNALTPWTDWAYNVQIVETYDPRVSFISSVPPPTAGNNVWDIGTLAPGASGSIQINVQIQESPAVNNGDIIINDVNLTYENQIGVQSYDTDSAQTVIADPILTISKSAPANANTGQYITYTITITNIGDAIAYNIIITENYPIEVTFIGAIPAPTVGNNIWIIPSLGVGASYVIDITVMVGTNVPQSTVITNNVSVDYMDGIGIPQPTEYAEAYTTVIDPVLTITKTGPVSANTGETIMYVITVTNTGLDAAYNVTLDELYPAGVIFVDSSDPGGTTDNIVWTIGVLASGATYTLYINVTIGTNVVGSITNWVYVNYEDAAGEVQPEESAAWTTQITDPDVVITKTTTNTTACAGGLIIYNVTYRNWGSGIATNVTITETYPAGVTFILATPPPTTGDNVWFIGDLAPGEMGWILIYVQVNLNVSNGALLNNTANVTYYDILGRLQPEDRDYAVTRVIGPILTLVKTGPVNVTLGEIFNYTVTYTNIGTDWAYNLVLRDAYPPGITILAVTPQPTNIYVGYYEWLISAMAPGASITIRMTVQVQANAPRWLNNTATLTYENNAGVALPNLTAWVVTEALIGINNPPEIYTTPPLFVWADQTVTIWAEVIDRETGVSTVIIYYTDIHGVQHSAVMVPNPGNYNTTTMNGWYNWTIPAQSFKGMITYYIWANDTEGLANRTGLFDVPVRLPPFYVWGRIWSIQGQSVGGAVVLVTDTDTNETVIAIADGTGNYIVDMATLYSGYMDAEGIEVFATDGEYYGYNYSAVDLARYVDPTMSWPNTRVDVVLNEIPEFTMILTPILTLMLLVIVLRRIIKKRSREQWEDEEYR